LVCTDEGLADRITEVFYHLSNGRVPGPVPIPEELPDNEIRQLIEYLNRFLDEYARVARAMQAISAGDLEFSQPLGRSAVALSYKALQSNLRHLTWKTQRISSGHLNETVDFMGEFSTAFNCMTRQLQESFEAVEHRNEELRQANAAIRAEREKSERLLLNVLPADVAEELKERGSSQPQSFDEVTVFFSDIVDFTRQASRVSPPHLIERLNEIFTRFDEIMGAHGCERIKTIGDGYLAVCGVPRAHPDHAAAMVAAAQEILDYMQRRGGWEVRIGIHSGPLVGGIVGVKKYVYDVFGDTVNTASRMEAWSLPMHINLSESTYRLVCDRFRCIAREPLEVKGKGEMRMYFLEGG